MPEPVLELRSVSAFYGGLCAIRDVSLTIAEGECVCLIGPNGAGKTTMLKAISGMLDKVTGAVSFLGRDAARMSAQARVEAGLIHVPEGRRVFGAMSVSDNLRIGGFARRNGELAARVDQVFDLFPRLRERRMQPAGTLSGGEQQMLAIGRALIASPKLLMLDEPSMGLAPMVVGQIYDEIRRLREARVTILLVEQNARVALDIADRALVLGAGVVRRAGSCAELRDDVEVQHMIFGG